MQLIRGAICSLHGRRLKRARQRGGHARKKPSQALKSPERYSTNLWLQMSR